MSGYFFLLHFLRYCFICFAGDQTRQVEWGRIVHIEYWTRVKLPNARQGGHIVQHRPLEVHIDYISTKKVFTREVIYNLFN